MPVVKGRGFDSSIFRVEIKCTCEGKPRIGYAETLIARDFGLDLMVVHAWADVSEAYLDRALDDTEGRDKYYTENGW